MKAIELWANSSEGAATMTERAKAIMQISGAHTAITAAREHLENIKAKPSITGAAATIEELTADLFNYIIQEYRDELPVEDETHTEGTDSPAHA